MVNKMGVNDEESRVLGNVKFVSYLESTILPKSHIEPTTKAQRQTIDVVLRSRLKITYRRMLQIMCKMAGREIKGLGDLTKAEADLVIKRMTKMLETGER